MFDHIWKQLFLTLISKKKKKKKKKIQEIQEKIWGCPEFQFYQKNIIYGSCENLPSKTILRQLILGNNEIGLKSPPEKALGRSAVERHELTPQRISQKATLLEVIGKPIIYKFFKNFTDQP